MGTILKGSTGIKFEKHKGQVGELNELEAIRRALTNEVAKANKTAATFRMAFLIAMLVLVPSDLGLVWMATMGVQHHVKVARFNDVTGDEEWMPDAPKKPVKPEQSVIHGVVRNWVKATRSISNDRQVFNENWDLVQDYSTQVAWRMLYPFQMDQIQRQEGGRRVIVIVGKFFPVAKSTSSYRISWKEITWDIYGQCLEEESGWWEMGVRIADFSSRTAQDEMSLRRQQRNFRNLFGVFIDEPKWSPTTSEGGKKACDSM